MMLSDFFMSPHGRISRQEYWLGMLGLMAITLLGSVLIDPDGFKSTNGQVQSPSLGSTIWSLLFAWPSTAIAIKRFNDRDWPEWVGYALGAIMAAFVIANYNGYLLDVDRMDPVEKILMVSVVVGFMWALIENGFQRGTPGPNKYGADPLAGQGV